MAKTKKAKKAKAKPTKQAGKPAARKDRVVNTRAGRVKKRKPTGNTKADAGGGDKSNTLPKPRLKPADVRTLQALIERLPGMVADAVGRVLQEHEQQSDQASVPIQPSPLGEGAAQFLEFMSEIAARLDRIEAAQQQPARDPSLDVPASVTRLRRSFAGACKTMAIYQPTPAIIGRIMHDKEIFSPDENKAPRRLFEMIYAKQNTDHLSPRIRGLLERDTENPARTNMTDSEGPSLTQQRQPGRRRKAPSSKIADNIGKEFDLRFTLIVNTGDGKREPIQAGKRKNYSRYLMPSGRELFDGWPEWDDRTGGIGLADEQMPPGPEAAGRPLIGATTPSEFQPASPPLQHSSQPPPAEPPTSQPPPPSPT